jgi:tetratricopeptide (TPR) repeat protein
VAISPPGLDRVPPGPVRDFVDALHSLYDAAGRPGARVISTRIRRNHDLSEPASHETVGSALRGASVPSWAKVRSIVVTLALMSDRQPDRGALISRFHALWLAANSAQIRMAGGQSTDTPTLQATPQTLGRVSPELQLFPAPVRAPRQTVPIGPVVGVPYRNPVFVGRELLLDGMRDRLGTNPHSPLVLYGLNGVGKSQLAREYLERNSGSYTVIWWVPAESPEQARGSMVRLAERLGITMQHSVSQTIVALLGLLESRTLTYALVLDDAGPAGAAEADEIRRIIPAIGGHVILTTRDPAWAHENATTSLEVTNFSRAEAIEFLRMHDDRLTKIEAEGLADAVGLLPLALDQIAALQVATSRPWTDLIAQLFEGDATLLAAGEPSHYPHTVAASLRLALGQLAAGNPLAVTVLEIFAWFGSGPVSITLLLSGGAHGAPGRSARPFQDPYQLRRLIADISRLGLMRLNARKQHVEVQPLTRLMLREWMTPSALDRAQKSVHEILAAADPGWPDDLASWESHRDMATHVVPSRLIESRSEKAQRTVLNQIRYRSLIGDHEDACRLAEAAVAAWREDDFLGADHDLVLLASHEWANACRDIGRYNEARGLTDDAMRRLRARVGDDHPYALAMALSITADLHIAGAYSDALDVAEEALRRHAERWGEADRRTAACRHNVGLSLRFLGRFEQARAIDAGDLDLHLSTEGNRHVRTLLSASALADDMYGLARYRDVLHILLPVLDVWREVAPAHAAALLAGRTVALAHAGLGEFLVAVERLRQHHYECVKIYGADHEHSLAATMSYALAVRHSKDLGEAHAHATFAENAYRRIFGARNPLTLAAEVNLAVILRAQGERRQARRADRVAWEALRAMVGDRHPFTIAAAIGLASDLWLAEDYAGAHRMSQQAYHDSLVVRGPDHPDTLVAAANLAMDRRAVGETSGADALVAEVLASLGRTLGPDHPTVIAVASGQRVDIGIEPPANLISLASSGYY